MEYKEEVKIGLDKEEYSILEETKPQEEQKRKISFEETWGAIPVSGGIYNSLPIIANDMVYFGSCDRHLYALTTDGKMLWKFATGDAVLSSPVFYNNTIYFGSGDGYLYALATNGRLRWKFMTGNRIISTPLIVEDKIYFGSGDGYFYCLSMDGKLIWRFLTGNAITNSPSTANNMIFFGSWDGEFYALDKDNGRVIWKSLCSPGISGATAPAIVDENFNTVCEFRNRIYSESPKIKNGIVYFGSQNNNRYAANLNGRMLWKFLTGGMVPTGGYVACKRLFFGSWDSYFYCLDAESGKELWKFKTGGPITAVPIVHKNKVYFCSQDQNLYVFDLNGKLLWQFKTGGNIGTHPNIVDDILYFGSSDSFLYAIDIEKRVIKWTFGTGLGTDLDKLKAVINTVIEWDRKIFKVWRSETTRASTKRTKETYKLPDSTFTFAGEHAYTSSSPYLSRRKGSYQDK
jgi:outer membrane protein assembly factor BamB